MTKMKRYLSVILGVLIIFTNISIVSAFNENPEETLTPEDIEQLYEKNMPEYLDEFNKLSYEEKLEFTKLLKDKKTWENLGEKDSAVEIHSETEKINERPKITTYASIPRGTKMIGKANGVETKLTLLGIPFLVYESDVEYKYTQNIRVTEITRANSWLKRALVPLYKTQLLNTRKSLGIRGTVRFIHSYKVGPVKDLSIQLGTYDIIFDLSNVGTYKLHHGTV